MKIVSLNLRYARSAEENTQKEREPLISAFLQDCRPVSVGFQETEPFWRERLDLVLEGYRRAQPQLMTKNYIYYDVRQARLVNHGVIWLSETPDLPSKGYGSKFYISATWAILELLDSGRQYVHINTHLDAFNLDIREKEIPMVMNLADRFSTQGLPVVITGDFNSLDDSTIYAAVLARGYLDAKRQASEASQMGTFNGFGRYESPAYHGPIDYFFINPGRFHVTRYDVTDRWQGEFMSDHNALCLEAELTEPLAGGD